MTILTNEVVLSVIILLILSLLRVNVVIALIISALSAGLLSNMTLNQTIDAFTHGLGNGAEVAMNYAILGSFAIAIARSGVTDLLAYKLIGKLGKHPSARQIFCFKYLFITLLLLCAIASQNLLPIHIAFIPIIVPPLLSIFNKLQLDRRAIACTLTFGLTATYMLLPIGFGKIFIDSVLVRNINNAWQNQAQPHVTFANEVSMAMLIPVCGMLLGLLIAIFISYRKPRTYNITPCLDNTAVKQPCNESMEERIKHIPKRNILVSLSAIVVAFSVQLIADSLLIGSLLGLAIFASGGIFKLKQTDDVFQQGLGLMAMIGFIMIAANGFAGVINATGGVDQLVNTFSHSIGTENKGMATFLMLLIGLLITMGIGSSFSTVPIIASIYLPICLSFGFSPLATISIIGVSAALGDAGSPASDSTLGPTSGLNIDGQHDHIWDSVVPTFLHFNLPLIIFGWIAAMVL